MQPISLSPFPTTSDCIFPVDHACPGRHRHCLPKRRYGDLSNGVAFLTSPTVLFGCTRAAPPLCTGKCRSRSSSTNKLRLACRHPSDHIAQEVSENVTNGAITTWPSQDKSLGIVITGGSKGLGFALARKFLELNDRVIICGRDEKRLKNAISALQQDNQGAFIDGIACDVSNNADVERLAEFAAKKLGVIDRWLNNAGEVTSKKLLADVDADEIVRVSTTNVVGSLLCCREAIRLMRQQSSSPQPLYHIFNMGFSQWGAKFTKSSCTHKATKIALTQLTESLSEELKIAGPIKLAVSLLGNRKLSLTGMLLMQKQVFDVVDHLLPIDSKGVFCVPTVDQTEITNIGVHNLSPGLVLTDLLLKESTPIARRFFNTLAEEPDTVAEILAPRIQAVQGSGQSLEVLSPLLAIFKVVTGFPQIISGGRFFDKDGNRVVVAGKSYHDNGVKVIY